MLPEPLVVTKQERGKALAGQLHASNSGGQTRLGPGGIIPPHRFQNRVGRQVCSSRNILEHVVSFSGEILSSQRLAIARALNDRQPAIEPELLRKRVVTLSSQIPIVKDLQEIPGIGPVLSATFVAYVGNPPRFSNKFNCSKQRPFFVFPSYDYL
jgi:hypothetical protein